MALTEPKHAEAYVVSQAEGLRSKDEIVVAGGSGAARVLVAGQVLGKRLAGTAVATALVGNTGNGVMGAITVSGAAKPGRYLLVVIEPGANVGVFVIFDPDGIPIPVKGNVAGAFSAGGLAFTLADGATDFVSGDGFTIDVTPTSMKFVGLDTAVTTGEAVAAGILRDDVTAPDATDTKGVAHVRDCEVNLAELTYPAGFSATQKAQANRELAALGIIVR